MKNDEMMESLDFEFDFDELDLIEKEIGGINYDFPVITVGNTHVYFNSKAFPYIPEYFKWYVNDEWCVMKISSSNEKNAYKSWSHRKIRAKLATLPIALRNEKTIIGTHKLYKTKNGLAFKKFEFVESE